MKKVIYSLILLLVVVSGLVFANRDFKSEKPQPIAQKPLSAAEKNAERKRWEASPEGIKYKEWEASSAGRKVLSAAALLQKPISDSSNMEAVITSLDLPPGSRLGYGMMVRINNEEYILSFGVEEGKEFQPLQDLKVNDRIIIRSHFVSHAPKYSFAIVTGDYVEHEGKVLYKRAPNKGGC